VSSARNARRSVKYQGRRAAPTQAGKIAGVAAKAVPALAVVGVLVGAPQLHGAAAAAVAHTAAAHVTDARHAASPAVTPAPHQATLDAETTSLSGTLSCSGLEQLWVAAGGSPSAAFTAAKIAMAESGGNQFAVSSTDDIGYWQINEPAWGSRATTDPIGNAQAAISISSDGTNWSPWVTYQTGAYQGKC
jgi:Lysozyme like domain